MYKYVILLCAILTLSCSKSRKYAGDYLCEVDGYFYELYSYHIDTNYKEFLEVKREKKMINVLNRIIHGDSLKDGEWYDHSGYPSVFKIKIVEDSMLISTWNGGQGGGASHFYSCKEE